MKQKSKVGRFLLVMAVPLFMVLACGALVQADEVGELIALANKIQNEKPGIGLNFKSDKKSYQISEPVVLDITADKDCYLAVINLGTSGRMALLFPNKWQPNNKIEKGKTYRIPPEGSEYALKVLGPPGTELIKVIASIDPVLANVQSLQQEIRTPVEQSGSPAGTFLIVKNPELVLKDIGSAVAGVDPSKWATLMLELPVAAAQAAPAANSEAPPANTQKPDAGKPSNK